MLFGNLIAYLALLPSNITKILQNKHYLKIRHNNYHGAH